MPEALRVGRLAGVRAGVALAGRISGRMEAVSKRAVWPDEALENAVRMLAFDRAESEKIAALCARVNDWAEFLGAAAEHGVYAPVAARALPYLPDPVRSGVARALAALSLRDAYLVKVLREAVAALEEAGVATVALKGPVMAERLFPPDEPRASEDLDLLILPGELDRAVQALRGRGYAPDPASLAKRGAPQNPHLVLHGDRTVSLELHYRASADFSRPVEAAELVARAGVFHSRHGFAVRVLAPEDEFLFLTLHAAKHNYGLSQMYDLKLLLERFPDLNWDKLAAGIHKARLDTVAYIAMERMKRLWGKSLGLKLSPNWVAARWGGWLEGRLEAAAGRGGRWRQTLAYALLCDPLVRAPVVFAQRAGHFAYRQCVSKSGDA